MKMKYSYVVFFLCLLFGTSIAMADNSSKEGAAPRVLPVLVHVDNQGKITSMDPASKLQPGLKQLLRQTLDDMISKPAHDKHGNPIASQFIIDMEMQSIARADGKYSFKFKYLSAQPVPPGKWSWSQSKDGSRVALVNQVNGKNIINRNLTLQRMRQNRGFRDYNKAMSIYRAQMNSGK